MAEPALLACDWGTTNLRAWTLDASGAVLVDRDLPLGVSRLAAGEAPRVFAEQVRPALGAEGLPAVLCGMVGSNLGWTTVPYRDCPATLADLASAMTEAPGSPDVRIVPGVRSRGFDGQGDVMRGEETQLFGWLAQHPDHARGRSLVCHPGTHTKWMVVEDGRLSDFVTAMTGELFAVLSKHSVLKSDAPPDDSGAFDAGLAAAGDGDALAARLFTVRARVVGGGAAPETSSSYLSGLLIGADVAATPQLLGAGAGGLSDEVVLLGDARLCALYARALQARGVATRAFDGEAAAVAGLRALHLAGRSP
ncbi:MAG: 2-dehydro-3-deoxygalactonokinase [Phenylobacterium sp.]|uniref:2-dehydro-3-deoxygalactonokinase n=1 Tax=Phenylobacterium sp. TaxID=1871053 RepID=UPI001A45A501|nr:2-dehydro-3-deoxygalactonokinase [Phenylobacterium sp.]MBL8773996.1 2-dehydro-3-deoxygalactonokinase [Phenylobacterium sp.]